MNLFTNKCDKVALAKTLNAIFYLKCNSLDYLRLRDTAGAHVVTVYSKFTYARYNFHLKQPRLGMYFFQPNIEFSSYVYEVV